jgi:hypothetical protein
LQQTPRSAGPPERSHYEKSCARASEAHIGDGEAVLDEAESPVVIRSAANGSPLRGARARRDRANRHARDDECERGAADESGTRKFLYAKFVSERCIKKYAAGKARTALE